jgi:ankyrin repeat domain-containing protein 50
MPTQVYDFYREAIKRIDDQSESDRKTAMRALSYISCVRRPLNVEELRHALSVEIGDTKLDRDNFPATKILFDISAGLIRVDEKCSTTALVRHTLQEYLVKYPNKLLPEPEMELATTCLTYLSFDVFKNGPCSHEEALDQRVQEYRFLDYAPHHWGYYVIEVQLHKQMDLLRAFLKDEGKLYSSIQILNMPWHRMKGWYNRFPKQFSSLYVVAYWGLYEVLNVILQEDRDINNRGSYGATALLLAAQCGHITVAHLLIDNGAEIDMRTNKGETALQWAARNGHKIVVDLLIANGANVMTEDDEEWTELDWAVIRAYDKVVKALLDQYPDVGSASRGRNKALILAAEAGNETVIQILLHNGAEINWKEYQGSSALSWLCRKDERKLSNYC